MPQQAAFDVVEATIPQLQAALAAGTVTSRELVTRYLERIAAYDQQGPTLTAISFINPNALADAEALDQERRERGPRGPLHGIPVLVKDNYGTSDMPTTAGSALLAGWLPPDDATMVTRLREAGAIIIAKTTMHEWARGIESWGSGFGQVRNPYAPEHNAGGSSGGTGAGVAASFAAAGLGSDTCGSIRIPSGHNGLAGIRGTQGLFSRAGILPLSHTQDIGGPMARTVTDLAIMMDALAGYDPADPTTAEADGHVPASYVSGLAEGSLKGARFGLLTDLLGTEPEDAEMTALIRAAAAELRSLGAEVQDVSIEGLAELLTGSSVLASDFHADIDEYLSSRNAPVRSLDAVLASGVYYPNLDGPLRTSQQSDPPGSPSYLQRLAQRQTVRQAVLALLAGERLDALLYPPIRRPPVLLGESQPGTNCQLSAHSGLPALVVPCGTTAAGIPVGLELLGRAWSEPTLLRLAYAYEQATHHRRPPASTPPLSGERTTP